MLQFRNETGLPGAILTAPDPDGVDSVYALVKGTFDLSRECEPAEEQVPVAVASEHYGDPAASSVRVPGDVCLSKPSTDVLLCGHAYSPGGRATTVMDVSLTVGPVHRVVRVFGDRRWTAAGGGYALSYPEPFETMPLVWERAYGGTEMVDGAPQAEVRNPVGRGFHVSGGSPVDGAPAPNLEDPYDPIQSWKQRPAPACFAPIAPHWEPRRSLAGTYDERWQRQRAPYLPEDFDPRFFQVAPPGLVAPAYLQGGEPVEIRGATPSGHLAFRLPVRRVEVTFVLDQAPQERIANLDTVLIEPDAARLILVWRAGLACDKRTLRVREVRARFLDAA